MRGFSGLNITDHQIDSSLTGALRYLDRTIDQARALHERAIWSWRLPVRRQARLDDMWGLVAGAAPANLAGNLNLQRGVGRHLIRWARQSEFAAPHRQSFLVTLISDRWLSYSNQPVIWLEGMMRAARQVMRLGGFDGWIARLELQTVVHWQAGLGNLLLPHIHAYAWSNDPRFDRRVAEQKMAGSGRLLSVTGMQTVTVKQDRTTSSANRMAYFCKAASVGKHLRPDHNSWYGFVVEDCKLRPGMMLRQNEILAGMTMPDVFVAGGEGRELRKQLVRDINNACIDSATTPSCASKYSWKARGLAGRRGLSLMPSIDRTGRQLPARSPISMVHRAFAARLAAGGYI